MPSSPHKLQAYKTKQQAQNQILKRQIADHKKQFGMEFMDILIRGEHTNQNTRQEQDACLAEAMADLEELLASIDENVQKMANKEDVVRNERINGAPTPKELAAKEEVAKGKQEQPLENQKKHSQAPCNNNNGG